VRTARLQEELLKLFDWKANELKALRGLYELTTNLSSHFGDDVNIEVRDSIVDIGQALPREIDDVMSGHCGHSKNDNVRLIERVATFVRGQFIVTLAALVEDSNAQAMRIVLRAFPEKIGRDARKVNLSEAVRLKTVLDQAIESEIYSIFMGKQNTMRCRIAEVLSGDVFCEDHWQGYIELRARRDVALHNGWRPNQLYFEKSGNTLNSSSEMLLYPTPEYTKNSFDLVENLLRALSEHCKEKFRPYTRIEAFKRMWERSSLSKVVPFEEAWDYKAATDTSSGGLWGKEGFDWRWSHSETLIWQFFCHIFYGQSRTTLPDIEYARKRLKRDDVQIIDEWLDSPFHL